MRLNFSIRAWHRSLEGSALFLALLLPTKSLFSAPTTCQSTNTRYQKSQQTHNQTPSTTNKTLQAIYDTILTIGSPQELELVRDRVVFTETTLNKDLKKLHAEVFKKLVPALLKITLNQQIVLAPADLKAIKQPFKLAFHTQKMEWRILYYRLTDQKVVIVAVQPRENLYSKQNLVSLRDRANAAYQHYHK